MPQPNFPTGRAGLIAVDKVGNQVRFLDPATFETVHALGGFPSRVHELAISPDGARAFVPIYGDGRHGANPNPGHQIAVIDLHSREHLSTFSVAPYLAPHGMRWGPAPAITIQIDGNDILIARELKLLGMGRPMTRC